MIPHRVWEYSMMSNLRMYVHRIRFKLRFCTITFCRLGDVKDRFLVSLKLNPSWPVTTNEQFVEDEVWWSSFLVSQLWKANFVLMWIFLWKNLQEQALSPSLLCWRFTESFWSVGSETRSVWLITWWRMTTSPLKMQRLLSSFLLKQIRYHFFFSSSQWSFWLLSVCHQILRVYLTILHLVYFLILVILEFSHPILPGWASPAHPFPALLALLVMPVGSCRTSRVSDNCCSVPPSCSFALW